METPNEDNWFKAKLARIKTDVVHIGHIAKQIAKDDPKRIIHSIKVGLAITLVSLFYYFDPLYQGFGVNAMWAVLTVVVVFEFSVGATLGKGVNRVMATILGGMAGVGAHRLASFSGDKLEPAFLGLSVFLVAAVTTFLRFFPKLKARGDYGLVIFILTFSLISVSGYRDDEVIDMAHRRISTILIGSSTAVIICVVICPVWAGNDLHKLVASNIHKLANFLEEFGDEYFKTESDATSKENKKASLDGFKNVIDSKSSVDSLVNFARWEPRHGRFKRSHPWTQYRKIAELTRHCACRAEALRAYLHCQIQAPKEAKDKFQEPCIKMITESSKALKELSMAITKMSQPSKAKLHIQNSKQATQDLNLLLRSNTWNDLNLSDLTPVVTVTSLLSDVISYTEEITEAVQELARLANFKNVADAKVSPDEIKRSKFVNQASIKRRSFTNHVIIIEGSSTSSPRFLVSEDLPSLALAQQIAE